MKILFLFVFLSILSLSAKEKHFIIVAQDGTGDYNTLTDAVKFLPMFVYQRTIIYIRNGVYEEKIRIEQDNVTLYGEDRDSTIIQYNLPRPEWIENKDVIGPAVINLTGDNIILENLTVKNTQPDTGIHAFAVYGTGTRTIITDCNLISKGGDTVSLWDYKTGMYYHSNCYFQGAVDFVCPRGWCYIKDSQFYEVRQTAAVWHAGGYKKDQKFVIVNSSFDGVEGFKLGRHHYEAQFYFIDCTFSGNMADEPIYRVTYEDTTRNRPFNWGERYYFYDCVKEGENFEWIANNLGTAEGSPSPSDITPEWTFDGKWNPEKFIPSKLPVASEPVLIKDKDQFILNWLPAFNAEKQIIHFGNNSTDENLKEAEGNKSSFYIPSGKEKILIRIDTINKNDTTRGIVFKYKLHDNSSN